MEIIYAREPLPASIFLAGPTPRDAETKSWRPEALRILEELDFSGKVFVPEDRDKNREFELDQEYDHQVHWEWTALGGATVIVFWVPRELKKMPAFVTNVEFGLYIATGKVLLGAPEGAAKMGYLKALATRFNVPAYNTLEELLTQAIEKTKRPYGKEV